jgi:hypothetical protein
MRMPFDSVRTDSLACISAGDCDLPTLSDIWKQNQCDVKNQGLNSERTDSPVSHRTHMVVASSMYKPPIDLRGIY